MTVENLSNYVAPNGTVTFEGFEKLRLDDYAVCELIQEYVLAALSWVEGRDILVHKLTLSPNWVRAYVPPAPEGYQAVQPEFVEIPLPKGLYERAVDLSCGPLTPFPVYGPSEEVKLFLGRLHQAAFPDLKGETAPDGRKLYPKDVKHVILNAFNYSDVRKWLQGRIDQCTSRDELRTGFQGVLYESEEVYKNAFQDREMTTTEPPPDPRSVKVWISRSVPTGSAWTSANQPPPNWDPSKVEVHELSTTTPSLSR